MTPTPFGEHFFLAQLPSQVRAILAAQEFPNVQELALAADRIIEANELLPINSVSALSPRQLKNLQPKHKPKPNPSTHHIICYYHKKFGPNARTCRPGCPFASLLPVVNVIVNHRAGKRASRPPMTAAVGLIKTNTLSVWDRATGTSFLVDTGADVCVFPASPNDKRKRTPTENLTAANGSLINT